MDAFIYDHALYKIGEIVAVAQSYKSIFEEMMIGDNYGDSRYDAYRCAMTVGTAGYNNKMYVKAKLMPHQIQITGIKAERMQDVGDEDCLLEGVGYNTEVGFENGCYYFNDYEGFRTPKNAFAALINRINGKGTWELNPYVFAYSFELIK